MYDPRPSAPGTLEHPDPKPQESPTRRSVNIRIPDPSPVGFPGLKVPRVEPTPPLDLSPERTPGTPGLGARATGLQGQRRGGRRGGHRRSPAPHAAVTVTVAAPGPTTAGGGRVRLRRIAPVARRRRGVTRASGGGVPRHPAVSPTLPADPRPGSESHREGCPGGFSQGPARHAGLGGRGRGRRDLGRGHHRDHNRRKHDPRRDRRPDPEQTRVSPWLLEAVRPGGQIRARSPGPRRR